MMKSSELIVMVDSVEEAIKFYTEKLGFDIVDMEQSKDNPNILHAARIKKGKCLISFKAPQVEELAEFSFIKRCASRCIGLSMEMKKGIERYYARCQKKGLKITRELRESMGTKSFALKDPFGIKLVVAQPPEDKRIQPSLNFLGLQLSDKDATGKGRKESEVVNDLIDHLKGFGILRRASKKYAKHYLKQFVLKAK